MSNKFVLLILSALIVLGCSQNRPKGFEMQKGFEEDYNITDSLPYDNIYISDSKPIDSLNPNQLIYDIFRIEADDYPDEIRLFTRVYDSLGNFATQMANPYKKNDSINYFTRLDEELGKVYNIREKNVPEYTVREWGKGDSIPYNLLLSIDYSGSMEPVMGIIHLGTEMLIKEKYPYDNIGVASFNNDFDLKVPLMKDTSKLLSLFRAKKEMNKGLFSGFLDATNKSIDVLKKTRKEDPRVLVLFTDGDDNYSKKEIGEVVKKAKEEDVHIFTVAFGYSIDKNLVYLAEYTGGRFYRAKSKQELLAILKDIYNSLRQYYEITYKPPKYWGYHNVFAEVTVPGRDSVLIANGNYDTSDLFPWDDLGKVFERPILFEFDSARVQPESYPILDEITDAMMSKPSIRLEIQGHTDKVGSYEYNIELSERRAKAVMDQLIKRGIEPRRLRYRGLGYTQPVADNDTEEGRAENRRTVFKVTAK